MTKPQSRLGGQRRRLLKLAVAYTLGSSANFVAALSSPSYAQSIACVGIQLALIITLLFPFWGMVLAIIPRSR